MKTCDHLAERAFPAPFSPISAWTSPDRNETVTSSSAWVMPKRLLMLRATRNSAINPSIDVSGDRRLKSDHFVPSHFSHWPFTVATLSFVTICGSL